VLEIGGNRAIDLIVTKEQGGGGASRFGASAGRSVGDHPQGGALSVKSGRYGPYVNWGKVNANLPKGQSPDSVTLEEAIALVNAKAAGGDAGGGRVLGEHPSGGAITLREGRYGPYVALGKVYANVPKSTPPESVTLADAIEWIEEKGGAPKAKKSAKKAAKKPAAKKAAAKKTASRKVIADSDEPPFDADAPKAKAAKKPAAKKVAKKAAKKAAKKVVRKAAAG
jgi:DNA topoisomerase-1